jgi:hypothetical protein
MSWSYSGDPSTSNVDAVRFLIGDTDIADPIMSNEEISWLLTQHGTPAKAAYHAALSAAGKYARMVNQEAGRIKVKAESKFLHYKMLAVQLRDDMISGFSVRNLKMYAGGISVSDMQSKNANTDKVQNPFSIGQDDYYEN